MQINKQGIICLDCYLFYSKGECVFFSLGDGVNLISRSGIISTKGEV